MTEYLSKDLGWTDQHAGFAVSLFAMAVTLSMLGLGGAAESFGLRRAIAAARSSRARPGPLLSCPRHVEPRRQHRGGARRLVDHCLRNRHLAAGLLLGHQAVHDREDQFDGLCRHLRLCEPRHLVAGALSAWVRPGVQKLLNHAKPPQSGDAFLRELARISGSGVQAANWLWFAMTALAVPLALLLITRRAEATRLRPEGGGEAGQPKPPWPGRLRSYFSDGPFSNVRFLFFIFMLLPVRTLFVHQWLTMPEYILRAYPE